MLNQKKYVKVNVKQSNLKGKKDATYYSSVCKKGKMSEEDLIKMVRQKAPFIDGHSFETGLKVLVATILECVEEGYNVELFGLGTVGLKGKGAIKVDKAMEKSLKAEFEKSKDVEKSNSKDAAENEKAETTTEFEGSYEKELNQIAKKNVEFSVQFTPSRQVKKHIAEYVEPSFITAKVRKPKIESVEKVYSGEGKDATSIIKIKGEDLKVVGDGASLVIKTEKASYKIPKADIIHNEPKTLIIVTKLKLKNDEKYSIHLNTQYAKMGDRQTSIIRRCIKEFSFEKVEKKAINRKVE